MTRPAELISSVRSLSAPLRQIAENAGHDGAVVAGKLVDGNDQNMGFNAQTEVYENLVTAGVIDPTKVVRAALQDAASIAGLLITTEAAIAELPEDKPAIPMAAAEWVAWAAWISSAPKLLVRLLDERQLVLLVADCRHTLPFLLCVGNPSIC